MKRKKKNLKLKKYLIFLFIIILLILSYIYISKTDSKFFETVFSISQAMSKETTNKIIDSAVEKTIKNMNLSSKDFLINDNTSVMIDTILINRFCTELSSNVSNGILNISNEKIYIPLGAATNIDFFANFGPKIPFTLHQVGETDVDYETSFESAGINQTNFKIWINININIRIVNPLKDRNVSMIRKIMLVDTVIIGDVPSQYLNWDKLN